MVGTKGSKTPAGGEGQERPRGQPERPRKANAWNGDRQGVIQIHSYFKGSF